MSQQSITKDGLTFDQVVQETIDVLKIQINSEDGISNQIANVGYDFVSDDIADKIANAVINDDKVTYIETGRVTGEALYGVVGEKYCSECGMNFNESSYDCEEHYTIDEDEEDEE
jgi:hypothetical protein